ncbi:class I SAM-dependent methyltransferase [Actinomycetaceae bacterium L2_0104]
MTDYWNHNTAYHPWIARVVAERGHRDVLDVGCGDGLLLERLAPTVRSATGIEPDAKTVSRAHARLARVQNVTVEPCDFDTYDPGIERFDLITFVASLHHLSLRYALSRTASLLRPGGDLLVIGLAANRSPLDWGISGLSVPLVWAGSRLHGESRDIGVPVAPPQESLAEIRSIARTVLPGARIRRGMYYRYLLRWTKPLS